MEPPPQKEFRVRKSIWVGLAVVCVAIAVALALNNSEFDYAEWRVDKRYENGKELARAGDYAAALKTYLDVFERSRDVEVYGGVRLSFLLGSIVELAPAYPPAREALIDLRDKSESRVIDGSYGPFDIEEWVSISETLGETDRLVEVYDDYRNQSDRDTQTLALIVDAIAYYLVDARRYDELREYAIRQLDLNEKWLESIDEQREEMREWASEDEIDFLIGEQKRLYLGHMIHLLEIELALGETEGARRVVAFVKKISTINANVVPLIESAERAGRVTEFMDILPGSNRSHIKEILRRRAASGD